MAVLKHFGSALLACVLLAAAAVAQVPPPQGMGGGSEDESALKVAFVYNFAKFVQWPQGGATPEFPVCVLGDDPFGPALDRLTGKRLGTLTVVVRRLISEAAARECRVLFVSASEAGHLSRSLRALEGQAVLTVSDLPGFAEAGGMIGLITEGDKLRFVVNHGAARRAGLAVSSRLLSLARTVIDARETGRAP